MRMTIIALAVALFSVIGMAQASADPTPDREIGEELFCKFRGHDFDQNSHLKCRVKVSFCNITGNEENKNCGARDGDFLKIECSNGFDFHSRSLGFSLENGNFWINADDHHKLATLKLELNRGSSVKADLLIAGRVASRLHGKCFYRTPQVE